MIISITAVWSVLTPVRPPNPFTSTRLANLKSSNTAV